MKKWIPKPDDYLWVFNYKGEIGGFKNPVWFDKKQIKFGNYFKSKREAIAARDKVKELLNSLAPKTWHGDYT